MTTRETAFVMAVQAQSIVNDIRAGRAVAGATVSYAVMIARDLPADDDEPWVHANRYVNWQYGNGDKPAWIK